MAEAEQGAATVPGGGSERSGGGHGTSRAHAHRHAGAAAGRGARTPGRRVRPARGAERAAAGRSGGSDAYGCGSGGTWQSGCVPGAAHDGALVESGRAAGPPSAKEEGRADLREVGAAQAGLPASVTSRRAGLRGGWAWGAPGLGGLRGGGQGGCLVSEERFAGAGEDEDFAFLDAARERQAAGPARPGETPGRAAVERRRRRRAKSNKRSAPEIYT